MALSESDKPDPKPADTKPADPDAAKRLRERAEHLLARPVVQHDDSVELANGARLDYRVRAGFIPVLGSGLGLEASEPPAYAVVDNPLTWLEHFDLVFIDPPHTGWSVSASEAARKKQLSVDGDVEALAEVMRGWLAAHG